MNSGLLPSTICSFDTIDNLPKGNPIKKRRQYLDKLLMVIVFGDCVALWGHRYALLIIDVDKRYCWLYGMSSLSSMSTTLAPERSKADAGLPPHRFYSDFDRKLIGWNALQYILSNGSNIIVAPVGRQSSNGLAERTWHTLIQMTIALITEKQVGREFWYLAVRHSAMMLNQVPGQLGLKLTTPF